MMTIVSFIKLILFVIEFFHFPVNLNGLKITQIPESSRNWNLLLSTDGVKFTARNAHASCVFKGEIWLTGGRVDLYSTYNLISSYKEDDVWHSADGATWKQVYIAHLSHVWI
jgi:hypothetical protein